MTGSLKPTLMQKRVADLQDAGLTYAEIAMTLRLRVWTTRMRAYRMRRRLGLPTPVRRRVHTHQLSLFDNAA